MSRIGQGQDSKPRSRYACGHKYRLGVWVSGNSGKVAAEAMDGEDIQGHPPYEESNTKNHSGEAETHVFTDSHCPTTFDGLTCWPTTPAGDWSNRLCPAFTSGAKENKTVSRYCRKDGLWESSDSTNYVNCGLDQEKSMALRHLYRRNWFRSISEMKMPGQETKGETSVLAMGEGKDVGKVSPYSSREDEYVTGMDEIEGKVMRESSGNTDKERENSSTWFFIRRLSECMERKSQMQDPGDGSLYCPITFDGWSCWNQTKAGETAHIPCPHFITGFDPNRYAFRKCMSNGSWFVHPESGASWSNYTTCIDLEDLKFRQLVNNLYTIGYSISFAALVISLLIFLSFRSLKCTRIVIHIHLFLSFAVNDLMWIIWYRVVIGDPAVVQANGIYCQLLHLVLQYLMVANYLWMFCEGLHLHLALVVVFVKDEIVLRWFYFLGWGLPLLLTTLYGVSRWMDPRETTKCWMEDSLYQWVLTIPVFLSLTASFIFLVNVVRVLLTKLHSRSANPAPIGMKKAVRATLILIPLFGIQHVLIPFRPEPKAPGEAVYQIFSAVLVSLQGFCVSCLFCFANVDVHQALRSMVKKIVNTLGRNSNSSAGVTGGPLGYSGGVGNGTTAAFAIGDRGGSFRGTDHVNNSFNNQTNQTCPDTCV